MECGKKETYMRNSTLVESKNKVQFQQCGTSIHAFFPVIRNSMYKLLHTYTSPQNLV
jgi:hypothetical protein